jgi:hypothetical protein
MCINHWAKMRFGMKIRFRKIIKGVWAFCIYLFVPQKRPKDYYDF